MLKSADVTLRALEDTDLKFLYDLENDAEVWGIGSDTLTPISRYNLRRYLENAAADFYEVRQLRLVICAVADNRAVGTVDVFDFQPHHRRAAVGIMVARAERQRGYAVAALQVLCEYAQYTLQLHQLHCTVAANNTASLRLFRAAGFRRVGVRRHWLRTAAGWLDAVELQYVLGAE
ncbi:GNAT family N-acetyltransferase [Hymenobacter busanensis]|uniref:GNAT family N-acetyltransferase n=1 Tax=Hymenobacter busanensis TaxID=2607656 RepID=A0A7L5A0A1_9BACT|nr:GNAT family N-acetyltransferase [Hymenobacter busanensis]KAA9338622.1 GNAT family N-acetyltransferase [Hymenobacter busanensis]QHJ08948.1 GNAT family N-acetyltransferase [Hymenobacter busanensis]